MRGCAGYFFLARPEQLYLGYTPCKCTETTPVTRDSSWTVSGIHLQAEPGTSKVIRLFQFSSPSISLSFSRICFWLKGYLHLCFHLCPSLKSTEETASYIHTRVNIKMLKLLQASQTRKQYILLLDTHNWCVHWYFWIPAFRARRRQPWSRCE